jgi:hypothetical protein
MLVPMIRLLRRYNRWLMVLVCALVVRFLIKGLEGAAMAFALFLVWRFLLVVVSLDPDKPRMAPRQNPRSQAESWQSC